MAEPLTDRQQALIEQVRGGSVEESEPDTEDQLLALARLGYLHAEPAEGEWKFTVPEQPPEDTQAAAEQSDQAGQQQQEQQPQEGQAAAEQPAG